MLRSTATRTRSLVRSLSKAPASRSSYSAASAILRNANSPRSLNNQNHNHSRRPKVLLSLPRTFTTTTPLPYAAKVDPPQFDKHDPKKEQKILDKKLEAHPEDVSAGSSVRHVFESSPRKDDGNEMTSGIKADIETIKETFALTEVPRESLYLGLAGVLPYAATSLSTVYLAWDINHAEASGTGYLFTPEVAHQLLDMVTPIQIGYGAVIISFLGAIHWGLEYAGYGGHHSYNRYMYGVIAPAVAWPTIFLPVEYALITQFAAFIFMYFADARATVRGWFPPWYSTYRFVLTFFVGSAIVISLIGRGQIVKHEGHLKSPVDYVKKDKDEQWVALEAEEKERRQALAAADEADEADEEETVDDDKDDKEDSENSKGDEKEKKSADAKMDDKKDDKKDDEKSGKK